MDIKGQRFSEHSKVQVFGEFSQSMPEGAWGKKLDCLYNYESKSFEVCVNIIIGQKFKFVIDGGKDYVVSNRYIRTKDSAGNLNNVFLFHERSVEQND